MELQAQWQSNDSFVADLMVISTLRIYHQALNLITKVNVAQNRLNTTVYLRS